MLIRGLKWNIAAPSGYTCIRVVQLFSLYYWKQINEMKGVSLPTRYTCTVASIVLKSKTTNCMYYRTDDCMQRAVWTTNVFIILNMCLLILNIRLVPSFPVFPSLSYIRLPMVFRSLNMFLIFFNTPLINYFSHTIHVHNPYDNDGRDG